MLTSEQQAKKPKQRKLRNAEYYDMESTFDKLYADSKKGKTFSKLMEIIESEENIKLICNDLLSRENLQGVTTNLFNCY